MLRSGTRPLRLRPAANSRPVGSGQAPPRHIEPPAYGCCLPALTGFTGLDCAGPGPRRHFSVRPSVNLRASDGCSTPLERIAGYRAPLVPRLACQSEASRGSRGKGPSLDAPGGPFPRSGGDERARTADLCLAKAALSQLSYIPVFLSASPCDDGGEGGIRTLGTLITYTRFPVAHLRPLSHLSE